MKEAENQISWFLSLIRGMRKAFREIRRRSWAYAQEERKVLVISSAMQAWRVSGKIAINKDEAII